MLHNPDTNFLPYNRSESLYFLSKLLLFKSDLQRDKRTSSDLLTKAKNAIDEAFLIENPINSPISWGLLKMIEAEYYIKLTYLMNYISIFPNALKSINSALEIFNPKDYPSYNTSCNEIKKKILDLE